MLTLAIVSVALLHAAYLAFQMLGALLILRHRSWLCVHLAAVSWGVLIVVVQGSCPVTMLEKYLIARSGATPYSESFLDHYLFGAVLPDGTQALVYGLHLLIILGTYTYVLNRLHATDAVTAPIAVDAIELGPGDTRLVGSA